MNAEGRALRSHSPEPVSLRDFRAGYWFGGFNGLTWMIGLGTPMVLLAERLGATTFQVGLASSFLFLLLPVQVLSTATLPRLGFQGQMVLGWLLRACFLLIPVSLAWVAPATATPWMASLLVASVFGFCLFRAFGAVAHIPWFSEILPDALRGRYFATDHAITSAVGVVTLLTCSLLFDRLPGYDAFVIVYGIAVTGSLLAVLNLLRLPDAPRPAPVSFGGVLGLARRLCLRRGLFRHYLLLFLLASVVTSSFPAFSVYYLKSERGLSASQIMIFTAVQFAGQIGGTWGIRRLIDRIAIHRLFQLSALGIVLVNGFWLALVTGAGTLDEILALSFFAFGAAQGVTLAAHCTYLPELSEQDERPVAVSVFTSVHGLLAGIAPTLWGLALRPTGVARGMDLSNFALYFACGIGIHSTLVLLYAWLPDHRASKPG